MQHFCSRLETCTPTSQQGTHTRGQPAHTTPPLCGSPSRSRTSRRGCRQPRCDAMRCDAMRCDAPTPPTTPSSRSQRSRSLPPPHSPQSPLRQKFSREPSRRAPHNAGQLRCPTGGRRRGPEEEQQTLALAHNCPKIFKIIVSRFRPPPRKRFALICTKSI
ncbi:uncharacterized protein LOC107053028 isoform X1 [Gallus gallus]|uniref:uncharacterized protein LOC107053028 isoform X1 n=2 Tax=Gallus gallus TaxID=9031 RepID=UPI001F001DD3|nr:uncharacterized protein LOC107053028 isoform X1 [Gallus gallus]